MSQLEGPSRLTRLQGLLEEIAAAAGLQVNQLSENQYAEVLEALNGVRETIAQIPTSDHCALLDNMPLEGKISHEGLQEHFRALRMIDINKLTDLLVTLISDETELEEVGIKKGNIDRIDECQACVLRSLAQNPNIDINHISNEIVSDMETTLSDGIFSDLHTLEEAGFIIKSKSLEGTQSQTGLVVSGTKDVTNQTYNLTTKGEILCLAMGIDLTSRSYDVEEVRLLLSKIRNDEEIEDESIAQKRIISFLMPLVQIMQENETPMPHITETQASVVKFFGKHGECKIGSYVIGGDDHVSNDVETAKNFGLVQSKLDQTSLSTTS